MAVDIKFLGAAGTVTGSKFLVSSGDKNILVDAGLFQGSREWREKNWQDPEIDLAEIDAVMLTHAHIDHTGLLPRYARLGLKCPVYATKPTVDLANILLPDSAYLQEEEARYRKERGKSRHQPPEPLYTGEDAKRALSLMKSTKVDNRVEIIPGVFATWKRMGHILGAASITLEFAGKVINFSGDVGRYSIPILNDPEPIEFGDLLLLESTYGSREHLESDPASRLAEIINATSERGGATVIPSFAVGRAQLILFYLRELKEQGKIPDIPIVIDSPLAEGATEIYRKNPKDYDEEALGILDKGRKPFEPSKLFYAQTRADSIKLNQIDEPIVIISASGMLSGGRILHHLHQRISSPKNSIVFVGYQPAGGRGAWILSGADSLRLFQEEVPIRAKIEEIAGLSAHADQSELIQWCQASSGTPGRVALVHGEDDSRETLAAKLREKLNWQVTLPGYQETLLLE